MRLGVSFLGTHFRYSFLCCRCGPVTWHVSCSWASLIYSALVPFTGCMDVTSSWVAALSTYPEFLQARNKLPLGLSHSPL